MNLFTKRLGLVLAGVVGVGAIASLAMGASFALFSSTAPTQSQTFAAGTVYFGSGSGGVSNLTIETGGLAPGDIYCGNGGPSNDSAGLGCPSPSWFTPPYGSGGFYQINYAGSLNAFVGLDVTITSTAACTTTGGAPAGATPAVAAFCDSNGPTGTAGTQPIWTGNSSTTVLLATGSDQSGFVNLDPSGAATCGTNSSNQNYCTFTSTLPNLLQYCSGSPTVCTTVWTAGDSEELGLIVEVAPTVGNTAQGSGIALSLNAVAVQHRNNSNGATPPGPISWT